MTLGIIDVGTNSIHLMIGLCSLDGRFHIILKERDMTRLGEGGLAKRVLTRQAMSRAMAVLGRYADILRKCHVEHVEAVATSAVRDAANGEEFVARVRSRLKLPLRTITGKEEARLIYLGVVQEHRFRRPTTVITIGGGSVQVIHADGLRQKYAASVPLGAQRLAERFLRHDPPWLEERVALESHARKQWTPVVRQLRRYRCPHAVGSSATIAQLMLAAHLRSHRAPPKKKQNLSLRRGTLRALVEWLASSTSDERIRLPGIDPQREDLLLPAGIVLLEWMEAAEIPALGYAPGSLREGLVVDTLLRHHQRTRRIEGPLIDLFYGNGNGETKDIVVPWKDREIHRMVSLR